MRSVFLPPGVQTRLHEMFGVVPHLVTDESATQIERLWRQRNKADEKDVSRIDEKMLRIARPSVTAAAREVVGRKRVITRTEMQKILVCYLHIGGDLRNTYVEGSFPLVHKDECVCCHGDAFLGVAHSWERMVEGIRFVSVGWGLRDGSARYDEPGRMAPGQRAEAAFASPDGLSKSSLSFIRRHTGRLFLVR